MEYIAEFISSQYASSNVSKDQNRLLDCLGTLQLASQLTDVREQWLRIGETNPYRFIYMNETVLR
jgi:hypothetical protein